MKNFKVLQNLEVRTFNIAKSQIEIRVYATGCGFSTTLFLEDYLASFCLKFTVKNI